MKKIKLKFFKLKKKLNKHKFEIAIKSKKNNQKKTKHIYTKQN